MADFDSLGVDRRLIVCPRCGLSIFVFKDEPLPEGGPVCAMGHEPVRMQTASSRAPTCTHCGEPAPYGDERIIWLSIHTSRLHRWWWKLKKKF